VRLRASLDVLGKKREKKKEGEKKENIGSGFQSKNNIIVSVISPNFTRQ
jgi:predicted nucleic acid-binding protein